MPSIDEIRMKERKEWKKQMRAAAVLSSIVFLVTLGGTSVVCAQDSESTTGVLEFHEYLVSRFSTLFPNPPAVTDITYMTAAGIQFPARQFLLVEGPNKYSVTVVDFSGGGPAVDEDIVVHAQHEIESQGELIFQSNDPYEPGIESRHFLVSMQSGEQLLGAVYMWDHRLLIAEARGTRGEPTLLRFVQSVTLLGPDGSAL